MADLDVDQAAKLYRRMLRLPLFYSLQPLHDCSVEDENFESLVNDFSQSLDRIEDFFSAYCLLVNKILSMKILLSYDPNFVANLGSTLTD